MYDIDPKKRLAQTKDIQNAYDSMNMMPVYKQIASFDNRSYFSS